MEETAPACPGDPAELGAVATVPYRSAARALRRCPRRRDLRDHEARPRSGARRAARRWLDAGPPPARSARARRPGRRRRWEAAGALRRPRVSWFAHWTRDD